MTSIRQDLSSFFQETLQREEGSSNAPAQGNLQGRRVEVQPHAHKIASPPPEQAAPTLAKTPRLEQRQSQPTDSPPALVRQARYGALLSAKQLILPSESSGKIVQARSLPSMAQLVARAGPVKSNTLLERFLSLFRSNKSQDNYQNILTGLQDYHDSCKTGTGQEAKTRLDELTTLVNRYSQGGDSNHNRAGIIEDLRRQITSERSALTNLMAELEDDTLPQGATFSHALAFIREGISLKEMTRLIDKGLTLDQTQEAREILESEKLSSAYNDLSSGYLKVLAGLDKYHAACAAHNIDAGAQSDTRAAEQAMSLLEKLDGTINSYLNSKNGSRENHPRTEALKDLRDQISIEQRVLRGLLNELRNGDTLPKGAKLSDALAFSREGVSLQYMTRLMSMGLPPSRAAYARELLDLERGAKLMDELNRRTPEQRAKLTGDFSESEYLLLQLSGLGKMGGEEYRRLGIPITQQTIVMEGSDEQRLGGDMSRLGKGGFNEVYTARYNGPNGVIEGIFKPLSNTEKGWVAGMTGIDMEHPKIANRNLATQDVARALGFDVVVSCQIGSRYQPTSSGEHPLQIGLVMGRAPGKTAQETPRDHYANPEVRREITKLQLLDHLTGQGDRHDSNYFIHMYKDGRGQTKVKVSGIDNDQCFGKNVQHGNDICYVKGDEMRLGFRGTKMPELIDTDMAAAIRSITPARLSALLSDKLSTAEVKAAHMRLQSLHDHVSLLEKKQQVITPAEWNDRVDMSDFHDKDNSYFARDARNARIAF